MATQAVTIADEVPPDPDAQATVTDFLDYTEYLPSDLIRSLTLISKLDETYLSSANTVHDLTRAYGSLPTATGENRPNPQDLRQEVSRNLDYAIEAREASFAEAARLYEVVDRHYNRLTSIISKLKSLPKPPSRDPTPTPQLQTHTSRVKKAAADAEDTPPQRITLRFDAQRAQGTAIRTNGSVSRPRHRNKKVTVPGGVLPLANPDSPPPITDSEWEYQPPSPVPMATSRVGASTASSPPKPGRSRPPKPSKADKPNAPKALRPPRPPGAMGTNVHSAVAGISTSNALSLLQPPPPDAKPGSEHAPWMRLTDWEMAKLRKRMKKNAIWSPSETMIKRELADAGRGPDNYRSSKSKAEAAGEEFTDFDQIATAAPGKPLAPGEISADLLGLEVTQLSNKGMKLNEAKKLKRELMLREQAALAAAEAGQRLNDVGNSSTNLFSRPGGERNGTSLRALTQRKARATEPEKGKEARKFTSHKRKRGSTPQRESIGTQTDTVPPAAKRRKAAPKLPPIIIGSTITKTTTVPLAAPNPPTVTPITAALPHKSPVEILKSATSTTRARRLSLTVKSPAAIGEHPASYRPPPLPPPPAAPAASASRPPSRATSRRGSSGAPLAQSTRELRRKSTTPAPATPMITAAGRRSRRPAPGPVTNSQDGGAAVSEVRRKNAPRRRANATATQTKKQAGDAGHAKEREEEARIEEEAAGEEIDPDEPRYCLCGDVSFGTMICCENSEVSLSSLHLLTVHFTLQNRDFAAMLIVACDISVRERVVPSRVRRLARTAGKTYEMVLP